jgi:hypothetical protein
MLCIDIQSVKNFIKNLPNDLFLLFIS